ncbi:MAG: aldo/keto reductase [Rhizobiaceae bacterium]
MRLGLGTVQFGLDYGMGSQTSKVSEAEVRNILSMASDCGIKVLDTAHAYGQAEAVVGRCLNKPSHFQLVTKTVPLKDSRGADSALSKVRTGFAESLDQMKVDSVYGLLVHHADDLLSRSGTALWELMGQWQREGRVERIGCSVYTGAQIDQLLERFPIEIVQLPINVLDQRLAAGGQLQRLKNADVEIHARSIFLQGLLLRNETEIPPFFDPIRSVLRCWERQTNSSKFEKVGHALAFVRSLGLIDTVVFGVHSAEELRSNICALKSIEASSIDYSRFSIDEDRYLNPGRWVL